MKLILFLTVMVQLAVGFPILLTQEPTVTIEFNSPTTTIFLPDNTVVLRGGIDKDVSDSVVEQFESVEPVDGIVNLFIDSTGGDYNEGMRIVTAIKTQQNMGIHVNGYVEMAASMAFIILQHCDERNALPTSTIMQHHVAVQIPNFVTVRELDHIIENTRSMEKREQEFQAKRIGISVEEFVEKIKSDWYMNGEEAVKMNVADGISYVNCGFRFDEHTYLLKGKRYSKCPNIKRSLDLEPVDEGFIKLEDLLVG